MINIKLKNTSSSNYLRFRLHEISSSSSVFLFNDLNLIVDDEIEIKLFSLNVYHNHL